MLSRTEIMHIASLAGLELDAAEITLYQKQLSSILDHVQRLQACDTSNVPAMTHPHAQTARLREDSTAPSLPQAAVLDNAPQKTAGYFTVPPSQPRQS